jgi:hypothetical protein
MYSEYENQTFPEDIICDYCGEKKADYFCMTENSTCCCQDCKDKGLPKTEPYPIKRTGKTRIRYKVDHAHTVSTHEISYTLETTKYLNAICTFRTKANTQSTTDIWENVSEIKEDVTTSFNNYVHHSHDDALDFIVEETEKLVILTVIRKRDKVTIESFLKKDNGAMSYSIEGHGHPYKTRAEKTEIYSKKSKKKPGKDQPIMAYRGDGSVTTLDRLLRGEPDLAPPDTVPRLNL